MEDLRGKVVLVTGAASGLGLETATLLGSYGARLVLGDVNEAGLAVAAKAVEEAGGRATTLVFDARKPEECAALAERAIVSYGALNGAACAAGIDFNVPSLELSLEQWQRIIDVNLTGVFLTVQAASRAMVAHGNHGSIVTFASGIAVRGRSNGAAYAASKGGVISMSKSMALAVADHGIRVNVVAPGVTDTPMARSSMTLEAMDERASQIPLGRIGKPIDIARVVAFLLSDDSGWMTGQVLHANGGVLMP